MYIDIDFKVFEFEYPNLKILEPDLKDIRFESILNAYGIYQVSSGIREMAMYEPKFLKVRKDEFNTLQIEIVITPLFFNPDGFKLTVKMGILKGGELSFDNEWQNRLVNNLPMDDIAVHDQFYCELLTKMTLFTEGTGYLLYNEFLQEHIMQNRDHVIDSLLI